MCDSGVALGEKICIKLQSKLSNEKRAYKYVDKFPEYKNKYLFLKIFTKEQIEKYFYPIYGYTSQLASIEQIIRENSETEYFEGNKLFQRAKKYANNNVQTEIDKCINKIKFFLKDTKERMSAEEEKKL